MEYVLYFVSSDLWLFSLLIFNNTDDEHNAIDIVKLTFKSKWRWILNKNKKRVKEENKWTKSNLLIELFAQNMLSDIWYLRPRRAYYLIGWTDTS